LELLPRIIQVHDEKLICIVKVINIDHILVFVSYAQQLLANTDGRGIFRSFGLEIYVREVCTKHFGDLLPDGDCTVVIEGGDEGAGKQASVSAAVEAQGRVWGDRVTVDFLVGHPLVYEAISCGVYCVAGDAAVGDARHRHPQT